MAESISISTEPSLSETSIINDELILAFGNLDTIHCWKKLTECKEFVGSRRNKHTMVSYKNSLYVFGGDNGKTMLNDLLRYDMTEQSWSRSFSTGYPPTPRYHHSAVVFEDSMFIFGGFTGDINCNSNLFNMNDLYEYRFDTGLWTKWKFPGRKPSPRAAPGAAVFDSKLWIFAGYDGNTRLDDMWYTDLTTRRPSKQWHEVHQSGDIPPPCCNFALAVARNRMFVFSGQSGAKATNSLFEFNFGTHAWRRFSPEMRIQGCAPPPAKRYGHTMVAHDRSLYVFGGVTQSKLPNGLHCFDLDTEAWSVVAVSVDSQVPPGRVFHASSVVGDAIYVFGGTVENNVRSGEHYRFQLSTSPKCTLHDDFQRLLDNRPAYADLSFTCDDGEVSTAHSPLIAARCPALLARASLLTPAVDCSPSTQVTGSLHADQLLSGAASQPAPPTHVTVIPLPGVRKSVFEWFLSYIYTDCIRPTPDGEQVNIDAVLQMMNVYRLSLEFSVVRLESLCLQYLENVVGTSIVLQALKCADDMGLETFKEHCLRYAVKDPHYNEIVMSVEFEQIDKRLMVDIVRQRQRATPTVRTDPIPAPIDVTTQGTLKSDLAEFVNSILLDTEPMPWSDSLRSPAGSDQSEGYIRPLDQSLNIAIRTYDQSTPSVQRAHQSPSDNRNMPNQSAFATGDITLKLSGHSYLAHKAILAARSSYFDAMFRFNPESTEVNIQIGDVTPTRQAFASWLRYVYYGAVDMPPEDSLYLCSASHFYGFTNNRLQAFCKQNLEMNVSFDNVIQIFEAADRIQSTDMKRHALTLIVSKFPTVARLPSLRKLSKHLLTEIMEALADELTRLHYGTDSSTLRLVAQ